MMLNCKSEQLADGSQPIKAILTPIVYHVAAQKRLLHNSFENESLIRRELVLEVEMLFRHLGLSCQVEADREET